MTGRFQIPAAIRPVGAPPPPGAPASPAAPAPAPAAPARTATTTIPAQTPGTPKPAPVAGAPAAPATVPAPVKASTGTTARVPVPAGARPAAPAPAPAAPAAVPALVKASTGTTARVPIPAGASPAAPAPVDRLVDVPSGMMPAVDQKPEVPETYNVFLSQIASEEKREDAAKLLVEFRKCTLEEARELVTRSMIPVAKDVSKSEAEVALHRFRMIKVAGRMTLARKTS
jgi:ribosomal protein L7/L12